MNNARQVLLRRPKNDYDDYVWTFPKGKSEPNSTPEETALREVKEETGYTAEIVAKIPGRFEGGTGSTEYFLMRPLGDESGESQEGIDGSFALCVWNRRQIFCVVTNWRHPVFFTPPLWNNRRANRTRSNAGRKNNSTPCRVSNGPCRQPMPGSVACSMRSKSWCHP